MAQQGSPEPGAVAPSLRTAPSSGSLPAEAQREIRIARYLTLLALPFVVLLYYGIMLSIAAGYFSSGPLLVDIRDAFVIPLSGTFHLIVVGVAGLYIALIYVTVYRRLTRSELGGALGATLVVGYLTLLQGLIPLGWGVIGLTRGGDALTIFVLVLGAGAGILLLLAYVMGARAERRLQGAAFPSRA